MDGQLHDDMELTTDAELTALLNDNEMNSKDIDKTLNDKALKNQFTKTNVKNLIKNVLMNDDVAIMLRQTLNDDGECLFEPKLTRAKIKEMLKNYPSSVHQLSSYQQQSIISECRLLIEKEFPDDSEDEEYRPDKTLEEEDDFDDDDESKCTEISKSFNECEVENNLEVNENTSAVAVNKKETIGMRTRSKFSLNDTPLEIIEQAFIPPDITEDMYDSACENDEWMEFLSEFTKPLESVQNDDPEDDPEYNVLCDDDFSNVDQEEFRIDRSVKVTRREYNDLMNELNEFAESYLEFNGPEPQEPEANMITENDTNKDLAKDNNYPNDSIPVYSSELSDWKTNSDVQTTYSVEHVPQYIVTDSVFEQLKKKDSIITITVLPEQSNDEPSVAFDQIAEQPSVVSQSRNIVDKKPKQKTNMTRNQLILLKDQLTKHVQLTTQNYLLCTMAKEFKCHKKKLKAMLKVIKDVCKNQNYIPINIHASLKFIQDWDEGQLNLEDTNKNFILLPSYVKKFMLFYDPPVFIYPSLLPSRTYSINLSNCPIGRSEEILLVLKIEQVCTHLKEKHAARAKYRGKSLNDLMPTVLKIVHQRWFSHRTVTNLKRYISSRRNSHQQSVLRNYLVHGKIDNIRHEVNMMSVFVGKCLHKCDIKTFPTSWRPLVKQLVRNRS